MKFFILNVLDLETSLIIGQFLMMIQNPDYTEC